MKKIIALALALIMALSMASVAFAATTLPAADAGVITLTADITDGVGVIIDAPVVIDLNGHTYNIESSPVGSTGTETLGFQILPTAGTVTIKNGTISTSTDAVKMLIQNYATLTLENVTLDGTGSEAMQYVLSNNNCETALKNGTEIIAPEGAVAFDVYDFAAQGYTTPAKVTADSTVKVVGDIEVGGSAGSYDVELDFAGTIVDGEIKADANVAADAVDTDDASFQTTTGTTNPGKKVVVATNKDRTIYKVKSYDFTTGTKGYKGASYIDEIKVEKNGNVVIVLKNNYKLAEDKAIVGEIELYNKETKTSEFIEVNYTVKNNVVETFGEKKASEANPIPNGENTMIVMDEDGGYVKFEEELLSGVVKMNKEEKTFLNVIYGVDTKTEETIEAIEEYLGEDYVEEAIVEYYTFETRAFKNDVDFSYEAYEDDPHYFYLWNDGELTKIDAKYNDDEDVEAWQWTAVAEGTIIVTDVEIVLAAETTKNPNTGATDVVGMASALAVVSLLAVGAVALKK